MAEQLWSDERISDEAGEATFEVDGSVYVRHIISQLLVKMRGDCQAALDAANQRIAELEAEKDLAWGKVSELEIAWAGAARVAAEAHEELVEWEPLPNGRYDGADVYYYFYLLGGELCVFEAETGDGWPLQLPDNIRLCRRKEAGE